MKGFFFHRLKNMSKIIEYYKKKVSGYIQIDKNSEFHSIEESKDSKAKIFLTNQYLIIFKSIGKGISAEGFSHPNPKSVLLKFPPIIQIIA